MACVHVRNKLIRPADVDHLGEAHLCDDRAKLATCGRNSVRGGTVARREDFTRDDERRRVRPEILEEVGEAVEEDEEVLARSGLKQFFVAET